LKLLFQNPQCLIDIIVTNENFQSGFLSRLNSKLRTRRLLRCAAVGLGDVEQAVQHVLEELAIALEHGGKLIGIDLVAGDVLLGQIKDLGVASKKKKMLERNGLPSMGLDGVSDLDQ
jgi:hypothetical protein